MASNFISHHTIHTSTQKSNPQNATLLARFRAALADRFLVPGFCRFGECGRLGPASVIGSVSLVCVCPLRINSPTLLCVCVSLPPILVFSPYRVAVRGEERERDDARIHRSSCNSLQSCIGMDLWLWLSVKTSFWGGNSWICRVAWVAVSREMCSRRGRTCSYFDVYA